MGSPFAMLSRKRSWRFQRLFADQGNRLELLAGGERDPRSQPVPRNRREPGRRKFVVTGRNELHFLSGTLRSDQRQRAFDVLGRNRFACVVLDVQSHGSLVHDELDHDIVIATAHGSAVLRVVIAVRVRAAESEEIEKRSKYYREGFHW